MTEQPNEGPQNPPAKEKRPRKPRGRSRGEGSVFRRSDNRQKPWVAQVTVAGKLKTVGYFKTESEALAAKNKALHDIQQKTWVDSSKQTLKEYFNYWLEHVHKSQIALTTYMDYRSALDCRLIPALGHIQVQKLTVRHIQMFYSDLLTNEGLSSGRVRYLHSILRMTMEQAVCEGLVVKNVCREVKLPRLEKKERQVLTLKDAQHLWSVADEDSQIRAVLILAVTTTLRRGEILALHWQDVDLQERKITIRRSLARIKGQGLVEKKPKTSHSIREIVLSSFTAQTLEAHQVYQQKARAAAGDTWQEHDLVFCGRHGNHLYVNTLNSQLNKLLKKAGLPHMRLHDLRHSAVTILLKMGVPPHVVQEIAGHSDVKITLGVYGHVLSGQQEEAMQKWDDALKDL